MNITAIMATTWARAYRLALRTVGAKPRHKEPSDDWKARMLMAEHSPIRAVEYDIIIDGIQMWATTHLVRHHIGIEKFVHSQREDRRLIDVSRDELPQGELNDMEIVANAQSLINISRKRLCAQASPETRACWQGVKLAIAEVDPIMASKMVKECIYRGNCPELHPCGYCKSEAFKEELKEYWKDASINKE